MRGALELTNDRNMETLFYSQISPESGRMASGTDNNDDGDDDDDGCSDDSEMQCLVVYSHKTTIT